MRTEKQHEQVQSNGIRAAAVEIGITKRTLQRWMRQTYTAKTEREGREVHRPRVLVNESQTAKCGAVILRAVFDAEGRQIWHAHKCRVLTPAERRECARIEREARKLARLFY